jgi:hypothetical protein
VAVRQGVVTLYELDLTAEPDAPAAPPADRAPCARFGSWNPFE